MNAFLVRSAVTPLALATLLLAASACAPGVRAQLPSALSDSQFGALITSISEPSGFFDTDNLISNEDSYLHPISIVRKRNISGGAYIGVGPDQNFSYIAAIRPRVAFIVDIRRDNMLEHLLFKALFSMSRNRIDYLSHLFGLNPPTDTAGWGGRSIEDLLTHIDRTPHDAAAESRLRAGVLTTVRSWRVTLSENDLQTIGRFHAAFIAAGPSLRFNTFGRAPQPYYPDLRRLLTEKDRDGTQSGYLARESDFAFVKSLHERNLIIPVVGNFGGEKALGAIATWLREHSEPVSAFYTSNVEQYLFRDALFTQFAENVARLPHATDAIMIRSYFLGGHPLSTAGYHATLVVQPLARFMAIQKAGGFRSYQDLATRDLIPY